MRSKEEITIIYKPSGEVLAKGPKGWGMFSFEGNYYIANKYLNTDGFHFSGIPGICPYKFIYFWYHFTGKNGITTEMLGWRYWLPNPLFFFIIFRMALPQNHRDIIIKKELPT